MAPFNRDNKFGKRDFKRPGGGGGFGGGRGGGFGGKRDFGPKEMHSATCAECGSRCEVPFKPNGEKPVYCNNCFKREERPDSRRSGGGRDFGGRDSDGFGYGGRNERPSMHEAICDTCGKECEVPFRPTQGKPVYCDNCFGGKSDKSDFKSDSRKPEVSKKEFDQLNYKLDTILKRLDVLMPNKEAKPKQDAQKTAKKEEPAAKEEPKMAEKKSAVKKIGKKETPKKVKKAK